MMCRFLLYGNLSSEGARPVPTVKAFVGGPTLQGVRRAYRIVLTGKSTWRKEIRHTGSTGRKSFFLEAEDLHTRWVVQGKQESPRQAGSRTLAVRDQSLAKSPKKRLTAYTVCNTVCVVHYMTNGKQPGAELFENLKLELRRGCLVVGV